MNDRIRVRAGIALPLLVILAACGGNGGNIVTDTTPDVPAEFDPNKDQYGRERSRIWDLFGVKGDPNTSLEVNRYLWNASLDVLSFMPIERIDPFSGVIVMGYGTPPGGGRSYRATVYITDPAMDARSLKVALATRSGPVDPDTVRAVEDAILGRARQLRIEQSAL
jgi:hypothetical protein